MSLFDSVAAATQRGALASAGATPTFPTPTGERTSTALLGLPEAVDPETSQEAQEGTEAPPPAYPLAQAIERRVAPSQEASGPFSQFRDRPYGLEFGAVLGLPTGAASSAGAIRQNARLGEDDMTPAGKARLTADEGERLKVYKDTKGIATIGVGFNLEAPDNAPTFLQITGHTVEDAIAGRVVLTKAQSQELLEHEIAQAEAEVPRLVPNYHELPPKVQDALTNLMFNMGADTLGTFKNTLAAIGRGDGKAAAAGIRRSAYYKQVGARGERIAKVLEDWK